MELLYAPTRKICPTRNYLPDDTPFLRSPPNSSIFQNYIKTLLLKMELEKICFNCKEKFTHTYSPHSRCIKCEAEVKRKQYHNRNKDIICECGCAIKSEYFRHHVKTKKHLSKISSE